MGDEGVRSVRVNLAPRRPACCLSTSLARGWSESLN